MRRTVEAIFLRSAYNVPVLSVDSVTALANRGLEGDRSARSKIAAPIGGKRQVTLLQAEHVPLIAAWVGRKDIDAAVLRRNLMISGINLLATRTLFADQCIRIAIGGEVVLAVTGACEPCVGFPSSCHF